MAAIQKPMPNLDNLCRLLRSDRRAAGVKFGRTDLGMNPIDADCNPNSNA